jgi:hypothetical protein
MGWHIVTGAYEWMSRSVMKYGYADVAADNLSDCFNLTQSPLTFKQIPAPLTATFFINDTRPPTAPDDD